jgi:hypothetical protein
MAPGVRPRFAPQSMQQPHPQQRHQQQPQLLNLDPAVLQSLLNAAQARGSNPVPSPVSAPHEPFPRPAAASSAFAADSATGGTASGTGSDAAEEDVGEDEFSDGDEGSAVAAWVIEKWNELRADPNARKFVDATWSDEDEWKKDVGTLAFDFPAQFRPVTHLKIRRLWNSREQPNRIPTDHILVALLNLIEPAQQALLDEDTRRQVIADIARLLHDAAHTYRR